MKMFLFRPSFVTAGMVLQAFTLLCIFLSMTSVSAVPQYRPIYKIVALDDVPKPSRFVEPLVAPSSSPPVNGDPAGPAPTSSVSAAVPTAKPSNASSDPLVLDQSSGASHHLGGVHVALVVSAAASAVFLVF
ncbi:hypothetical protein V8E55_002563 [Tylopilus felleus]